MTVSYTAEVATCTRFGCFLKLLKRWRGSIYKLVWPDLSLFLFLYYLCAFVYRVMLDDKQKIVFEAIVDYCNNDVSSIPISFVLGFYVALIVKRWWDQYLSIPWPDPVAVFVSSLVHGQDEEGRVMRRTIMRYTILALTIVLTNVSPRVKKRFPTHDHLVDAGLMTENERDVFVSFDKSYPKHPKYWMPIIWAGSIVTRARKMSRVRDDFSLKSLIDELNKFRANCRMLLHYDFISLPLVYTQVVTLAVYSYFFFNIMGHQWTRGEDKHGYMNIVDRYFPVFSTLEFFFYVGWLKVAETLINPFGDDDDDFELNWIIDRDLQVSYLIVDEMHHEHPELIKDQYWDQALPNNLPYANPTDKKREEPPEPSTAKLDMKTDTPTFIRPSNISLRASLSYVRASLRRLLSSPSSPHIEGQHTSVTSLLSDYELTAEAEAASEEQEFEISSSGPMESAHSELSEFAKLSRQRAQERTERQRLTLARTLDNLKANEETRAAATEQNTSDAVVPEENKDAEDKPE